MVGVRYEPDLMDELKDWECQDGCDPFVDEEGDTLLSREEVEQVVLGDEFGVRVCPDCGGEVDQTMASLLDFAAMVAERIPSLGPAIVERVTAALSEGLADGA